MPMVNSYNPDVLNCIANLSNDEVFTPPALANQVLDLLPQDLFRSPKTRFLDPFTKSGVFLREIVKRLDRGLEGIIPDRQARIDHILHNQVFGIACTELTSLLARRSVYCSKTANGRYSVSRFDTPEGNIQYKAIKHTWVAGKCKFCGASQGVYDRGDQAEQYAYQFIHTDNPSQLTGNMTFDVIIGNPPYQLNVGVEQESYAIPLYDKFVMQGLKLKPRYLSVIIPSRWFAGGRGLDDFRDIMLSDNRLEEIHDFPNANDCFPGVDIKGGVCYFLWNREFHGDCLVSTHDGGKIISQLRRPLKEEGCTTFIRHNQSIPILHKVKKQQEESFSTLVSAQTPFGIISSFRQYGQSKFIGSVKLYVAKGYGYVDKSHISKNPELVHAHKIYITKSYGAGEGFPHQILNKPFIGDTASCCTQTYLVVGPFKDHKSTCNALTYMKTKFFRFMVMLKKNTQDAMRAVYEFVPLQDFSHPWTDEMLYKKYNLTEDEIAFIESMIRPMD